MSSSYDHLLSEILIDEATLKSRIAELGAQITKDYADIRPLMLICVLKGGVVFLTDLMRHIDLPHSIEFMSLSSYGINLRESSGAVRIDLDLRRDVEGKHLLIVEDIVDSGNTLDSLSKLLKSRNPASIKICALLSKPSRRVIDISIDYLGFEIPDKFVFGYGLDLDELYRNLPFIGVVKPGANAEE